MEACPSHSPQDQGSDQLFNGQTLDDDGEYNRDVGHSQDDVAVWVGGNDKARATLIPPRKPPHVISDVAPWLNNRTQLSSAMGSPTATVRDRRMREIINSHDSLPKGIRCQLGKRGGGNHCGVAFGKGMGKVLENLRFRR